MNADCSLPVTNWVVCISGYMQTEGLRSGIHKIQHAIHQQCSGPQTRVLLKAWRDCMTELANRITMWKPSGAQPRVTIIGYSYGGYTATLLADELDHRGVDTENLLLIDPVWRPRARWASPLSLNRSCTIDVPRSVKNLWYWRQIARRCTEPQGHAINVYKTTVWHNRDAKPLRYDHKSIDDAHEIKQQALAVACPT